MREEYARRMDAIRRDFGANGDGLAAIAARSKLVDELLRRLWLAEVERDPVAVRRTVVVAVGGYGREQLFPGSDIDVMFCVEKGNAPKEAIKRTTQGLWDCGLRASPMTRSVSECERFDLNNIEGGFSLLDRRMVAGEAEVFSKLDTKIREKLIGRDAKAMRQELLTLTRARHAKYGDTLFHLEPNIKDCPGGLRDANVCGWLAILRGAEEAAEGSDRGEFAAAMRFLAAVRCFLHFRHERDDNVLNWQAQDAAAAEWIGLGRVKPQAGEPSLRVDAAYWMRAYFRNARLSSGVCRGKWKRRVCSCCRRRRGG